MPQLFRMSIMNRPTSTAAATASRAMDFMGSLCRCSIYVLLLRLSVRTR